MLKQHKHSIGNIIILILTLCIAFALEYFISNFNEISNNDYILTVSDSKQSRVEGVNEYKFDTVNERVSTVSINYNEVDEDFSYTIEYKYEDDEKVISDDGYAAINYAATAINHNCEELVVKVPREVRITDIHVTNVRPFSIPQFLMIYGVFFLIIYLIYNIKRKIKIEHIFVYMCLICGLTIIFTEGPSILSWDEQIHFGNSWNLSYMNYVENSEASLMYKNLDYPISNTIEENIYISKWINTKNKIVESISKDFYVSYARIPYILYAIFFCAARKTGASFMIMLYGGKIINLLFYSLIFYYGIKKCFITKYVLAIIGLLPTSVFMAASYSYDPYLIAFVSVGIAFIFEEFINNKNLNINRTIIGVVFIVVGTFAKSIYIPILAIIFLFDGNKYKSKKQKVLFDLVILFIIIVIMATFVAPTIGSAINGTVIAGDSRGGATSVSDQIQYIISNPLKYAILLLASIGKNFLSYTFGIEVNTNFAYIQHIRGKIIADILYVFLLVSMSFTTCVGEKHISRKKWKIYKGYVAVLVFGIMCLIWTALYLSFTPVGLDKINGVQGRYYIPLFLLMSTLLFSRRKIIEVDSEIRQCFLIVVLMLVWGILLTGIVI